MKWIFVCSIVLEARWIRDQSVGISAICHHVLVLPQSDHGDRLTHLSLCLAATGRAIEDPILPFCFIHCAWWSVGLSQRVSVIHQHPLKFLLLALPLQLVEKLSVILHCQSTRTKILSSLVGVLILANTIKTTTTRLLCSLPL